MEEKKIEVKTDELKVAVKPQTKPVPKNDNDMVKQAIFNSAQDTKNVKDIIDLAATSKALENQDTVEKIVSEKTEELHRDAEAKKIKAETDKIREEVAKVKQEAEKEIAELEKEKQSLEVEVAALKAEDDKASQYFNNHKSILRCVNIREKLSLKAMQAWMVPASIIYAIFQIILLPFSLVGFAVEQITTIIGAICGKIAKNGLKIVLSIIVGIVIVGLVIGIYWAVTHYAGQLFG